MAKPIYRRVVVKVSGEALMGADEFGIHQPTLERIAKDLIATQALGVQLGVVVGGGNIFRGVTVSQQGIARVTGDMMGMLATVMNALALESALEKAGVAARAMSALAMPEICETYERRRALRHLAEGRIVLFSGRHRQSVLHHRHHRGAARRRDRRRRGAQGDRRRRRLQRRPEEGQEGQALRASDPPGGDRASISR